MKTVSYNDEAIPWCRNTHVLGTRSFPSSNDSSNNFSRTFGRPRTEIIINQVLLDHWNTPVTGTI
jgi:hypothetical protein